MIRRISELDQAKDVGRDHEVAALLAVLDPSTRDPNYWQRFRWWVLSSAAAELARRRHVARPTVADVLESWARALVPTAALVAALAGMLLLRSELATDGPPVVVQELRLGEVEGNSVPIDVAAMTFTAEIF